MTSKLPIKMADMRAGRAVSRRYRNRRIGGFLKELDLTEGRSTGITKIFKVMTANGSPTPEFETDEDRSYFLICFPVHQRTLVLARDVGLGAKLPGKSNAYWESSQGKCNAATFNWL